MDKVIIYTEPLFVESLQKIIDLEERLNELVEIRTDNSYGAHIIVDSEGVHPLPLWDVEALPVLFPDVMKLSEKNILGLIFFLLRNFEKSAFYFSENAAVLSIVELGFALTHGSALDEEDIIRLEAFGTDKHAGLHNAALAKHYVSITPDFESIKYTYTKALESTVISERLALTAKQFAIFLSDAGLFSQVTEILSPFLDSPFLSEEASVSMKTFFCHNEIKRLSPPFDDNWMQALKNDLWNCLQYHEQKGNDIEAAFVLTDASYVATISESYAEALGYISKAIGIFEKLEQPELTAQAMFQKARLLCTWAQTGQPQFYRDAMISCQSALKVFNQESNPGLFADIHHQLGVIYSEVPDEVQKKSIWAGVSVRSFTEALNFYNKVDYPYEFGVICNNQGNAYTKYPLAVHSDNFEKAMDWYREALSVRDAQQYPNERAITLLNYLEAAWSLNLENASEENLYNEMMDKAREVLSLSVGDALKSEAQKHIVQLNELVKEKQV